MNGPLISEIESTIQESKEKIAEIDPSFSIDSLELELDNASEEKAKLKGDGIGDRVKLIINPVRYSALSSNNKRKVLIYHEIVHFWIGKDIPPTSLLRDGYRERLWNFAGRFSEEEKGWLSCTLHGKRYDEGFEEVIVNETVAKILDMDESEYREVSNDEWRLETFKGVINRIGEVIRSIRDFSNIKTVIDTLTRSSE